MTKRLSGHSVESCALPVCELCEAAPDATVAQDAALLHGSVRNEPVNIYGATDVERRVGLPSEWSDFVHPQDV